MPQSDIDSLLPPAPPLRRRAVVRGALGVGFAVAVRPVCAQTAIRTPSDGLVAGEVDVPVGDFRLPAYRAAPAGRANAPVLLLASEIFGVHEHIADVARRLAHAGYFVVAPELFARRGDPGSYGEIARLLQEVVQQTPDAQVCADLDACAAWAAAQGADAARLGITGFCWGGRTALVYAAHSRALRAAVAWYGPVARAYHRGDRTVLEQAAHIAAPVLGLYGGADDGIPVADIDRLRAALKDGGNGRSEFVVYPGAPHAFHADYRPSYRAEPAGDGWRRMLAWFKACGVA